MSWEHFPSDGPQKSEVAWREQPTGVFRNLNSVECLPDLRLVLLRADSRPSNLTACLSALKYFLSFLLHAWAGAVGCVYREVVPEKPVATALVLGEPALIDL